MLIHTSVLPSDRKVAAIDEPIPIDNEISFQVMPNDDALFACALRELGLVCTSAALFMNRPGVNPLQEFLNDQDIKNTIANHEGRGITVYVGPGAIEVDDHVVAFGSDDRSASFGLWVTTRALEDDTAATLEQMTVQSTRNRLTPLVL